LTPSPLFDVLYQPRAMDDGECGAVGEMSGKGNRNTLRNPAPVRLSPPQVPHDLTGTRTWAATVRSQGLAV
jgi:hypothetical protein